MIHVPYKGEAPAYGDLIAGRIDVAVMTVPFTKPQIAAGKLRPIATISAQRARGMPNVPTVAEQGFPGYAGTPPDVIDTIAKEVQAALRDKAILSKLESLGVDPVGDTPAAFAKTIGEDIKLWAEAVKIADVKL